MDYFRIAVFVFACVFLCSTVEAGEQELLDASLAAHKATIQSITTFTCRVKIQHDPVPPTGYRTGEYWRSGSDFRCIEADASVKTDTIYQSATHKSSSWIINGKQLTPTEGQMIAKVLPLRCDPWSLGLLTFYGATEHRIPLDVLLSERHRVKTVRRDNGKIYLELTHKRANLKIWFNPAVNYLVDKLIQTDAEESSDSGTIATSIVTQFVEPAPGIFFPASIETEILDKSKTGVTTKRTVTFSDVVINRPLQKNAFAFQFPPNIIVSDLVNRQMMVTDGQGNPTIPAKTASGGPLKMGSPEEFPVSPNEFDGDGKVTEEEPQRRTRWILPVSLVLLGFVGATLAVRRIRAKRNESIS